MLCPNEEFVRLGQSREFSTCTDRLQAWHQPRERKLETKSLCEIDLSKKVNAKEKAGDRKILHFPTLPVYREKNTEKANQDLLEKIQDDELECVFFNILSREKHPSKFSFETTITASNIISPLKEQPITLNGIRETASRIKKKPFVDANERKRIEKERKQQSGSQEWFKARKIRITASKCIRANQKRTTSPIKAMIEIRNLKDNFQSEKMQRGLKDESKILKLYDWTAGLSSKSNGIHYF